MRMSLYPLTCMRPLLIGCFCALSCFSLFAEEPAESSKQSNAIEFFNIVADLDTRFNILGGNFAELKERFEKYPWNGIIFNNNTQGPLTIKEMKINNKLRAAVVRKGSVIKCQVKTKLNPELCDQVSIYRATIGLKRYGPQVVIRNSLGSVTSEIKESFQLLAPLKEGLYTIRFKVSKDLSEQEALECWYEDNDVEPSRDSTIGVILVVP